VPELAYLNGKYCSLNQATISIEDRGFQFADGVYEVLMFRGDEPLLLEDHMRRLANSCREIKLDIDLQQLKLEEVIREGVRRAGFERTSVYIQVTRGPASRNHIYPPRSSPTVVMTFKCHEAMPKDLYEKGVSVITMTDFRWHRCDIKATMLLPNVLAKNEALAGGHYDTIFVGPDGDVREATSANVFLIRQERLVTRQKDHAILPGVTRKLLLACAEDIALPTAEAVFKLDDLLAADEVFLTSTTVGALPVVCVDGQPIGGGKPGPWTAKLHEQMEATEFKVRV
jgi:D-alanine transaminase